ncbi:helix-turn-helix domain-containing protein [Sulfitobacter sp. M368]|jgi:XRE family transcriptional regulator, fatty acid utilization regulator|uniref:helix-turn-helix domain-containing protein n=1 Tax=Sulfitobacter sp. M368 TaxID=2867021 RepID=UPI0021A51D1D|nr:helix-turn-helix domain-containing protein [Sulfitobacter sp. M368]UWR17254.1 helix-turn-helix domain-containing protein [Sulfitobacter sp. M368]
MAREGLTGSRIRERRVMAGLKQADLARDIGISASYLNLIEHNRRRIGGKLLLNIAAVLGVEPQTLTEGAEAALIAALREAADEAGLTGPEASRADEFAGRFPGWADVLAGTRRRVASLEQTVEALTDRLAHDPHLAASMHELLSTAAAIRSTAAILAETKTLQPEWRERFHANINEDSHRLSDSAQALVSYLDAEADAADAASSPQEEVEAFLSEHDFSFGSLETGSATEATIAEIVETAEMLRSQAAKYIARGVLQQWARDAAALSLKDLRKEIETAGTDPLTLARNLHKPVVVVLRRLAALPELGAGLVVCDRSGTVIFRKSVEGFTVPRHGACCPLWPLFGALAQTGMVISETVMQLGRAQAKFECFATSETQSAPSYNALPLVQAVMVLLPASAGAGQGRSMGSTCRVCPQESCAARREPSILSSGV